MLEVVCIRCNKSQHLDRERLPRDFDRLNPGTTFKFQCCFCKNGLGRINDVCSYCQGRLSRHRKDEKVYCKDCGLLSNFGGRRCLGCGQINDENDPRCGKCNKKMFDSQEKGEHYRKTPKDTSFLGI